MPATASGRFVAAAIASMSSAEVFVNSSAPGFMAESSAPKTSCLTGNCSNTASITTSHPAIFSYASTGSISGRRLSISAWARLPRWTLTA